MAFAFPGWKPRQREGPGTLPFFKRRMTGSRYHVDLYAIDALTHMTHPFY